MIGITPVPKSVQKRDDWANLSYEVAGWEAACTKQSRLMIPIKHSTEVKDLEVLKRMVQRAHEHQEDIEQFMRIVSKIIALLEAGLEH